MYKALEKVITSMIEWNKIYLFSRKEFIEVFPIREYYENEVNVICTTSQLENELNIFSTEQYYSEFINNGEVEKIIAFPTFNLKKLEKIKKVIDVFCKSEGGEYREIGNDLIEITCKTFEEKNKWLIPTSIKGIAILNNFVNFYKDSYKNIDSKLPMLKIEGEIYMCIPNQIVGLNHKLTMMLDISNLETIKIEQLQDADGLKKIYEDIEPIVSKFFLRDFTLDNIYYDSVQNKFVILGISDYIRYNSDIIGTHLSPILKSKSLYFFKKTTEPATYDEYLIKKYGFKEILGWWEWLCKYTQK